MRLAPSTGAPPVGYRGERIWSTMRPMSRYIELHPVDPQARLVDKVVTVLREGGLIAYPTDSGYALACAPGNKEGLDRIRAIRRLNDKHNFTFVCASFAQAGPVAIVGNNAFRLIKRLTPGPWTFIRSRSAGSALTLGAPSLI